MRKCRYCDKSIEHKPSFAIYCNNACKSRLRTKNRKNESLEKRKANKRKCQNCGVDVPITRHTNALSCSDKCAEEFEMKRYYQKATKKRFENKKICKICGEPFHPDKEVKIVCSKECKTINDKANLSRAYNKNKDKYNAERVFKLKHNVDGCRDVARKREKRGREELSDTYVKSLMATNTLLSRKNIPNELIELKRKQIQLRRLIYEQNKKEICSTEKSK